jgi:hypothetical protein
MKLKTAAAFLFITAIISSALDIPRLLFHAVHLGTGIFAQLSSLFILLTIVTDVLFLLLGIAYRKFPLNTGAVKRIGMFMAITGGAALLVQAVEMATVGSLTRWLNPYIVHSVHLFEAAAMVILGTALAGNNQRYTGKALIIFLISIGLSALNLMYVTGVILTGNYNTITKLIHALSALVPLVFLIARLLWALAVWKNRKRSDAQKPVAEL